jgi:Rieske Fe-S protein
MNPHQTPGRRSTLDSNASTSTVAQPGVFSNTRKQITRRTFCNRLLTTSSGLLVAGSALNSAAATQYESQVAYPPLKIEGAERLMPGSSLYFCYPRVSDPAILVRTQDSQYYAYSQRCSHLGCSVHFDRARRCLECPCHKGAFDAQTGFVLNGPPIRPLDQIVLQMQSGELWAIGRRIGSSDPNA